MLKRKGWINLKKAKENIVPLMLMFLIPIIHLFYGYLNNANRGVRSLETEFDRAIPFMKSFIIPYIMWYPFILMVLVYLCYKHRTTYYKILSTLVLGMLFCYAVYFFYQTTVPRPTLTDTDLLTKLVKFIYNRDNPFNCFPSIHVLSSYLMMKGIKQSGSSNLIVNNTIYTIGILIILSTLFVKQHVVYDGIVAIILAELLYKLVDKFSYERYLTWIRKPYWSLTTKKKLEI